MNGAVVIRELEQELEATQQRCGQIEKTIANLREIYGITGDVDDEANERPNGRSNKRSGGKPARTHARTQKTTKAAAAPRSLPDDDRTADIVTTIRRAGGSMKLKDLEAKLGLSRYAIKPLVKMALKAKAIIERGNRASYRLSLPGHSAKEEP